MLELGTGTGAAWITHCLQGRDDVEVITVEIDAATAALAAQHRWPSWVRLVTGDGLEVTRSAGRFDLIFADAQGRHGHDRGPDSGHVAGPGDPVDGQPVPVRGWQNAHNRSESRRPARA